MLQLPVTLSSERPGSYFMAQSVGYLRPIAFVVSSTVPAAIRMWGIPLWRHGVDLLRSKDKDGFEARWPVQLQLQRISIRNIEKEEDSRSWTQGDCRTEAAAALTYLG
jgi:hypothetical protein